MKSKIAEIKALIADDELRPAFSKMKAILSEHKLSKDLTLLEARFENIQKESSKGLLEFKDREIAENKVRVGLLDLLESIEDSNQSLNIGHKSSGTEFYFRVVMISVLILITTAIIIADKFSLINQDNSFVSVLSKGVFWTIGGVLGLMYTEVIFGGLGLMGIFHELGFGGKKEINAKINFSIYALVVYIVSFFLSNNALLAASVIAVFMTCTFLLFFFLMFFIDIKDKEIRKMLFQKLLIFSVMSVILISLKHPLTSVIMSILNGIFSATQSFLINLF